MKIRIVLADDHKIVREGLQALLEKETNIEIAAVAEDGRTALQFARDLLPDVVVMDIGMPGLNGIEATRCITVEIPQIRVLVLSMHSARRYVLEALSAGAKGYMLKDCASEELARAIHIVYENETYLSPKVADILVKDYMNLLPNQGQEPLDLLSKREREVLQLIAEGQNTKEIAFLLGLSIKTVETHRQQIMKKLNLQSVASLTRFAIREGLTPLD
ncbi:MAG: response regulator transcription factor [Deltaproteobacteria bacterium]|nr:response regulator transcription factor [Deltaproteobacteria bacterium]TLN03767.1 MAG: response regulator transcription factor [bacterium]